MTNKLIFLRVDGTASAFLSNGVQLTMDAPAMDDASMVKGLELALQTGVVMFAYVKKDGARRFAMGTTNPNYIPQRTAGEFSKLMDAVESLIKTKGIEGLETLTSAHEAMVKERIQSMGKEPSPNLITYYDLGVHAWRSFNKTNLLFIMMPESLK